MARQSAILVLMVVAASVSAQSVPRPTGVPAVDSAAVARAAWAAANRDLSAQNVREAQAQLAHAAQAWPTQPSYPWALAAVSTALDDSVSALTALRGFADLHVGRDIVHEPAVAKYVARPAFAEVVAAIQSFAAQVGRGRVVVTLPDSLTWPEGVTYDSVTRRFFVASVRHGMVVRIDAKGAASIITPRTAKPIGSVLGVRADPNRGVLWVTTSGVAGRDGYQRGDSAVAALLETREADGMVLRRWDLPVVTGGHVLGDLVIGPDGDVFFTDSNEPVLYRLRKGADSLERIRNPLFYSLQGLAPDPRGRWLYLSDYAHGLLRVDVETGGVIRLPDAPHSTSLGCDGLAWDRGSIVAVQNGAKLPRVVRFTLASAGDSITRLDVLDQELGLAPEPTILTIAGDEIVYVANSLWNEFDDAGAPLAGAKFERPRLVAIPRGAIVPK